MIIISFPELVSSLGGRDEAEDILASFSISANTDVEDFLHRKIFLYEESHAARSFFAVDDSDDRMKILGFYSLAVATYQISGSTPADLKDRLRGVNNSNRKLIPGILIGQLARFDRIPKSELPGHVLMNDALDRIYMIHREIGLRFVWLDCKDTKKLKQFYEQFGFTEVNRNDNRGFSQMMAFFSEGNAWSTEMSG